MIIRIAVGSNNPCKINAVREAFTDMFQQRQDVEIVISSIDAESGKAYQGSC